MNISKRQQQNLTKLVSEVNKQLSKLAKRNPLLKGVAYSDKLPLNATPSYFKSLRKHLNSILQPGYSKVYSNQIKSSIYSNFTKIFGTNHRIKTFINRLNNKQLAKIREFPELRYLTYSYDWSSKKQEEIMDTLGLNEEDILNLLHEATKK